MNVALTCGNFMVTQRGNKLVVDTVFQNCYVCVEQGMHEPHQSVKAPFTAVKCDGKNIDYLA